MKNFENILSEISKPEIGELKHQDMLADRMIRVKRKTAYTWWWILLPFYIIATLMLKSLYFGNYPPEHFLKQFLVRNNTISFLLFAGLPAITAVIHFLELRKINFYSGSIWKNRESIMILILPLSMILLSLVVIILYLLLILT